MEKLLLLSLSATLEHIVLLVDWLTDFRLIEFKKVSPKHAKGLLLRGLGILLASIPVLVGFPIVFYCFYLLSVCLYYWICFDPGLNLLRDKDFFYKGVLSDPEEDAWFDKVLFEVNATQLLYGKIALFIICNLILVHLWNRM